jgi:type I restriction enzyme S subunit
LEARTQLRKQATQALPAGLDSLPRGWAWATLMQCAVLVIDCHNKTAPYSTSGTPLIRTTNVRDGYLNLKEPKFVDGATYERWSARCEPEAGDILITREAPMGEVALIPAGMKICLGQRMMLARLVPETIDPQFLLYSLRDPRLMDRVQDKPIGATVQHLRVGGIETLLIPLPPLAEQHRIVAKVDQLMGLCDQLEAQLTTSRTDSRRLLEAVLQQAFEHEDSCIAG